MMKTAPLSISICCWNVSAFRFCTLVHNWCFKLRAMFLPIWCPSLQHYPVWKLGVSFMGELVANVCETCSLVAVKVADPKVKWFFSNPDQIRSGKGLAPASLRCALFSKLFSSHSRCGLLLLYMPQGLYASRMFTYAHMQEFNRLPFWILQQFSKDVLDKTLS